MKDTTTTTIDLDRLTTELQTERGALEAERQRHALDAALGSSEAKRALESTERRIGALDKQLERLSLASVEQAQRQRDAEAAEAASVKATALAELERLRTQSESDRAELFRAIDNLLPLVDRWDSSFLAYYGQAHQCRDFGARPPRWDHRVTLQRYVNVRLGLDYVSMADRYALPPDEPEPESLDASDDIARRVDQED